MLKLEWYEIVFAYLFKTILLVQKEVKETLDIWEAVLTVDRHYFLQHNENQYFFTTVIKMPNQVCHWQEATNWGLLRLNWLKPWSIKQKISTIWLRAEELRQQMTKTDTLGFMMIFPNGTFGSVAFVFCLLFKQNTLVRSLTHNVHKGSNHATEIFFLYVNYGVIFQTCENMK